MPDGRSDAETDPLDAGAEGDSGLNVLGAIKLAVASRE
jgi:hypothetical protein